MAKVDSTASFYVYVHRRATDGRVFYVGKGKGRRAWSRHSRNRHWLFAVKKHGYTVEIVQDAMQEWWAFEMERELIALYGRETLTNHSDGGEGSIGWVPSKEFKQQVSIQRTGKKHSATSKLKMREIALNRTEEYKKKLSSAILGKPQPWNSGDKNAMRKDDVIEKRSGKNHHFYGVKRPDMTGENHHFYGKKRESMALGKHPNARPIVCMETGVVYPSINSAIEWLKSIGYAKALNSNISECCRQKRKKAYERTWSYA